MRLLPERSNHDGEGAARSQSESKRCRDSRGNGWRLVSMHDVLPSSGSDQTRSTRDGSDGRSLMSTLQLPKAIEEAVFGLDRTSRRDFLKASGALVITLSASTVPASHALAAQPADILARYPDPDFLQLDTWIVVHPDNTATFFVGKTDGGQGTGTAFRQMMCDELDIAFDKTKLVMGRTDITPDQGGSGGSDGVERDGQTMRRVAAEARRALLELGSKHLGVPVEMLAVSNGIISVKSAPAKTVTYAELI